jgi:uncharacterized protein Smg (DUF494 family)
VVSRRNILFVFFYDLLFIALECYDLAQVAFKNEDFYHTLMWMQEALDHLDKEINNTSIKKFDILHYLAYATSKVNDRVGFCQENLFFIFSKGILNMR